MPPDLDRGCITCVPSVVVVRIARQVVDQASAYAIVIREWGFSFVRDNPRLSHWVYRNIEELPQYLLQCLLTSKEVLNYSHYSSEVSFVSGELVHKTPPCRSQSTIWQ